ncbi:Hypothetical predicted protein [Podarcis lilfordi]|uniref:Uncharacterized protein n=1 Tax=Podarcis lilfordi TaxID=74358 RepID=A0AA35PQA8_9SAUR|nr:Hypothetical predicted protein [Podarcis lilfordi]
MGMGGNQSKDAKEDSPVPMSFCLQFCCGSASQPQGCGESLPSRGTDSLTFAFQLLKDEQIYLLGVIQSCQTAELRGLRSLKCSKQETAKAILDILGPLEHFRHRPLTLALALEALLQLSTMRPKFSCDMISAILHRTLEAELKRHFRLLLGSLLMEAPNPGTLLHLLSDLRGYALGESGEAQELVASSISLLLAIARKYPNLRISTLPSSIHFFVYFHPPKITSPSDL